MVVVVVEDGFVWEEEVVVMVEDGFSWVEDGFPCDLKVYWGRLMDRSLWRTEGARARWWCVSSLVCC